MTTASICALIILGTMSLVRAGMSAYHELKGEYTQAIYSLLWSILLVIALLIPQIKF